MNSEYHHTYIYKLVKSATSLAMHIISVSKTLKNISHIYISYTVSKKYETKDAREVSLLAQGEL